MPPKNRVTATDVAKKAGVSRWTVTRSFLNEESVSEKTKNHVKKIAEEMGYSPNLLARTLIRKESGMIAIVVDNFLNYHVQSLIKEVSQELQKNNLLPVLINLEHAYNVKTLKQAEQFQVDGIIFLGSFFNDYLLRLSKINKIVPLVVIGRDIDHPEVLTVSIDNYDASVQIANLFLSLNYQSFAYVGVTKNDIAKTQRLNGYRDALKQNNKKISLLLDLDRYDSIAAYHIMKEYLELNHLEIGVDAIYCENDTLAIGVLDALKEAHLENEVAVVGFDNIQLSQSNNYKLTTFDQNLTELAKNAVNSIYHPDGNILLKGELILRESHLIPNRK